MSPARAFYTTEANIPLWEKTTAHNIIDEVGYGFKIKSKDGNSLTAFSIPNEENLGYGRLVIPLRVPEMKNHKRVNHPYQNEAHSNTAFFRGVNRFSELLKEFDAFYAERRSGEFHFSQHTTIDGEWYLVVQRKTDKPLPAWRRELGDHGMPKSAAGLAESFNQQFEIGTLEPL